MPGVRQRGQARRTHAGVVRANWLEPGRSGPWPRGMHNPFRYFNSSPEVIRLMATMSVRVVQLPGPTLAQDSLGNIHRNGLPALLDAIVDGVAGPTERALVPNCAHDPHHQARAEVLERVIRFVRSLSRG